MNEKPLTYLDRNKDICSNKYFFVSYSHKDSETVYEVLNKFFEAGLNYWYDVEMRTGKDWLVIARNHIDDENCVGVIFFLSINCLIDSKAVAEEIAYVKDKNMTFIPILLQSDSYYSLVRDAFVELINCSHKELNSKMPFDSIETFLKFFDENKIFKHINNTNLVDEVISELRKDKIDAISTNDTNIEKLEKSKFISKDGNALQLKLSMMPKEKLPPYTVICPIKDNGLFKEFSDDEEFYYKKDKDIYNLQPIVWDFLDVFEGKAYFISKYVFEVKRMVEAKALEEKISKLILSFIPNFNAEVCLPNLDDMMRIGRPITRGIIKGFAEEDKNNTNFETSMWCRNGEDFCCLNNKNEVALRDRASIRFEIKIELNKLL